MLFEINQICFNEPDYATVHFAMNIMKANWTKMKHKMSQ